MTTMTRQELPENLPATFRDFLQAVGGHVRVSERGAEGWWGTLQFQGQTLEVQARTQGEDIELFTGERLLFVCNSVATYVNHQALGVDVWTALGGVMHLEQGALKLYGAAHYWLLGVMRDLSVAGRGMDFMPHNAQGHLSLLGHYPGGHDEGLLLFPGTLFDIAQRSGVQRPYPPQPGGWQSGPPTRPGTYWLSLEGEKEAVLSTVRATSARVVCATHPRTFEAQAHAFIPQPPLP